MASDFTNCVTLSGKDMTMPRELAEAMGLSGETAVVLMPGDVSGSFFLKKSPYDFRSAGRRLRHAVRSSLGLGVHPVYHGVQFRDNEVRLTAVGRAAQHGRFRIVDYRVTCHLIPEKMTEDAKAVEEIFRAQEDYNEHRSIERQDASARASSLWFARDICRPLNPLRILELGCGAGRNAALLVQELPGIEYTGLDIHTGALEAAERLGLQGARFLQKSLHDLSEFGDASFDVVFTFGVMMHIPHDQAPVIMREMQRMARRAVIHYELHGTPHSYDFLRYSRDYKKVFQEHFPELASTVQYTVNPLGDETPLTTMALLVAPLQAEG